MKYHQMTSSQKRKAQGILQRLKGEGVMETVSQIAVHFDAACDWDAGDITMATLLDRTGWTRTAPVETIHRAELPAGVLRHVRAVLAADGTADSKEALELYPRYDPSDLHRTARSGSTRPGRSACDHSVSASASAS